MHYSFQRLHIDSLSYQKIDSKRSFCINKHARTEHLTFSHDSQTGKNSWFFLPPLLAVILSISPIIPSLYYCHTIWLTCQFFLWTKMFVIPINAMQKPKYVFLGLGNIVWRSVHTKVQKAKTPHQSFFYKMTLYIVYVCSLSMWYSYQYLINCLLIDTSPPCIITPKTIVLFLQTTVLCLLLGGHGVTTGVDY